MKPILLALALVFTATAADLEPPKLIGTRPLNRPWHHVILTWTHPTAETFQVRIQSPSQEMANYIYLEDAKLFRRSAVATLPEFQDLVSLRVSRAVFSVRAIVGTNKSDWSNPVVVIPTQGPPFGGPNQP